MIGIGNLALDRPLTRSAISFINVNARSVMDDNFIAISVVTQCARSGLFYRVMVRVSPSYDQ